MPGTAPSSRRPTMFCQNQPVVRPISGMTWVVLMMTPANSGSITAHRNGLVRARAEHNSSQPAVGSAHRA
ncbi:hypothetical protein G6F55_013935 [Rhizopus delemar]|nr:hypothetical protein G6F55_013935 [Rhizopus delemar]